jgi:CRISPR-associated exonuclease Cas4
MLMNIETHHPLELQEALQARMMADARLPDRQAYLGASEVGTCLRRVVASKLSPEPFDAPSMGRMLAGRALENEVVQLVRIALNGRLRNTGRVQLELRHPELPFRAHPDGRIVGNGEEGDGVLEVKTASASLFRSFQKEGLPQSYIEQVQAQLGLAGLSWGLVVLVSRENLAEMGTFLIRLEPDIWNGLLVRAEAWLEAMSTGNLPAGEPDRGHCHTCPMARDCPQHQARRASVIKGELPELTRLELECLAEELAFLEQELDPLQQRSGDLKERLKAILQAFGVGQVELEAAAVQLIPSIRTSLDAKAIQREAPDLYQRFLKTSTLSTLRITFRGEHA